MTTELPLPALLSQVLVAFTIEFDNESEHQIAHRTARGPAKSGRGPWLVSLAMWSNFMQFVGPEGVPLREMEPLARITNLAGLERWGYITVEPDPADDRPKPPRGDWLVRPTPAGRRAQEVWRPLAAAIEVRWQARFGADEVATLRESLLVVLGLLDIALPFFLPVVKHDMFAPVQYPAAPGIAPGLDLSVHLSRVLLAFTIDFERDSALSLPMCSNLIRLLGNQGVRLRDLPRLAGVSKEAIDMMVGYLDRRGYVTVEPDPLDGRVKLVGLTPSGGTAHDAYRQRVGAVEDQWKTRFGPDDIGNLRKSLERLVGEPAAEPTAEPSLFSQGLEPYPEGWRATLRKPDTLPHYPMILHRGGFPDGS